MMVENSLTREKYELAELVAYLEWLNQSWLVAVNKERFPAAYGCSEMDSGTWQMFPELSLCARRSGCWRYRAQLGKGPALGELWVWNRMSQDRGVLGCMEVGWRPQGTTSDWPQISIPDLTHLIDAPQGWEPKKSLPTQHAQMNEANLPGSCGIGGHEVTLCWSAPVSGLWTCGFPHNHSPAQTSLSCISTSHSMSL